MRINPLNYNSHLKGVQEKDDDRISNTGTFNKQTTRKRLKIGKIRKMIKQKHQTTLEHPSSHPLGKRTEGKSIKTLKNSFNSFLIESVFKKLFQLGYD